MEIVDSRYGKLIASHNDRFLGKGLFKYGEFSEGEVKLFRMMIQKSHVVCDVGANIGAHTLVFSKLASQVYAFEPIPTNFNCLAGMVALNDLRNVTLRQVGISDHDGIMAYMDLNFDMDGNNFGAAPLEKFKGERGVPVYKLETPCNFLKVDVEGMEPEVLRGATDMIKDCQPALYVESDRTERYEELYDLIKSLGYYAYWHAPLLFNPDNFYGDKENIFGEIASFNLLCLPVAIENCDEAVPGVAKHPKNGAFVALNI